MCFWLFVSQRDFGADESKLRLEAILAPSILDGTVFVGRGASGIRAWGSEGLGSLRPWKTPLHHPRAAPGEPPQKHGGSPHMKSGDRGPEGPASGPKSPSKRVAEPNGNLAADTGPPCLL